MIYEDVKLAVRPQDSPFYAALGYLSQLNVMCKHAVTYIHSDGDISSRYFLDAQTPVKYEVYALFDSKLNTYTFHNY